MKRATQRIFNSTQRISIMISPSISVGSVTKSPFTRDRERPVKVSSDRAARAAASRQEADHDAELVRRFNAGDEAAFVEIMNRYREKIFSVALALLRNRADAEEIAQDTFIRAHRGLSRFRGDSSLATWLHRIAVNLARNRYWYFFRHRRTEPSSRGSDRRVLRARGRLHGETRRAPPRDPHAAQSPQPFLR